MGAKFKSPEGSEFVGTLNGSGLAIGRLIIALLENNQKKALGIVDCAPEEKANSAKTAMLFSRTNTLLSLPMLLSMVAAQNLY